MNDLPIVVNVVCKAAIIGPNGKLLLMRRSKTAPTRPLEWDLVGGAWDGGGENFEQAVEREASEEAGLVIKNCKIYKAIPRHRNEANSYHIAMSFTAATDSSKVKLSYEHDKYVWVNLHELPDYKLPEHWNQAAEAALRLN